VVLIKVVDANERPSFVGLPPSITIREDVEIMSSFYNLTVSDPDRNDELTITLLDGTNTFHIHSTCETTVS